MRVVVAVRAEIFGLIDGLQVVMGFGGISVAGNGQVDPSKMRHWLEDDLGELVVVVYHHFLRGVDL